MEIWQDFSLIFCYETKCTQGTANLALLCGFWTISLFGLVFSLSGNPRYARRPNGVNYRLYLHVLKYLLFISYYYLFIITIL